MPFHVKVSGTWQELQKVHVKVGGTWQEVKVHSKVSGTWQEIHSGGPTVSLRANGDTNTRNNLTCYSGFYCHSNGYEYEYNSAGGLVSSSLWLTSGTAAQVWIQQVLISGSWNSINSGTARLQCSTARGWRNVRTSSGTTTTQAYWKFYDASSGGNLLAQSSTSTWSATYLYDSCPFCCFTPDTLITLASGLRVPIKDVREGDLIETKDGNEPVGEVITRVNRAMYAIQFEDGRVIEASDDHPFDVRGVPASIAHHDHKYKDLPPRAQLEVGDQVTGHDGLPQQITAIKRINYPGTVYTFSNSLFYANGLLVY